jgi:repressor LexA
MPRNGSERRRQIVQAIRAHVRRYGYAPTYTEIMDATGIPSKSNIHHHLHVLQAQGVLEHTYGKSRTLRLKE